MTMQQERDFETGEMFNVCKTHGFRGLALPCPHPHCSRWPQFERPEPDYQPPVDDDNPNGFIVGSKVTYVRKFRVIGDPRDGGSIKTYYWQRLPEVEVIVPGSEIMERIKP